MDSNTGAAYLTMTQALAQGWNNLFAGIQNPFDDTGMYTALQGGGWFDDSYVGIGSNSNVNAQIQKFAYEWTISQVLQLSKVSLHATPVESCPDSGSVYGMPAESCITYEGQAVSF